MTLRSADRNVAERDRAITLERDQTRGAPGAVPGSVQISAVGTGVECSCPGSWFFPSRIKGRPRTGCRHHVVRSGCATHSGQASGCTGAAPERACGGRIGVPPGGAGCTSCDGDRYGPVP